jgi:regulator of sigma E protease
MLGGIIINLILGFAIYSMVLLVWGETVLPADKIPYGIEIDDRLESIGFQDGDQIRTINGEAPDTFTQIRKSLFFDSVEEVAVERNGENVLLTFNQDLGQFLVDSAIRRPFGLRVPCIVKELDPLKGAAQGGMMAGDRIQKLNGESHSFFGEVVSFLQARPNRTIEVEVQRMNGTLAQLICETDSNGTLGFASVKAMEMSEFQLEERSYSVGEAFASGFTLASTTLQEYVLSMRFLFSKSGASQVGSLVTFGHI